MESTVPMPELPADRLTPQRPSSEQVSSDQRAVPQHTFGIGDSSRLAGMDPVVLDDLVERWHENEWPEQSLEDIIRKRTGWTSEEYNTWVVPGKQPAR